MSVDGRKSSNCSGSGRVRICFRTRWRRRLPGPRSRVLELLTASTDLRDKLEANTKFFREGMSKLGFDILPGTHPIVPVMLGDAALASKFADAMLLKDVYVIGFSYPVVPQGKARIRTQISAAHSQADWK